MLNQQEKTYNNATINNAENVAICMMQDSDAASKKELRLLTTEKRSNTNDTFNDQASVQTEHYDFVGVAG